MGFKFIADNCLKFIIEGVTYLTQRDNEIAPSISCFPTSMGMVVETILRLLGLDKTAIGCASNMQTEDYINQCMDSKEVDTWLKDNISRIGRWVLNYKRRTIYVIEAYVFNLLMNPYGYEATYKSVTFDELCEILYTAKLPCVVGGNFASVSSVKGHMVCAIGYNTIGIKELIVHDPYGDALKGYKNIDGNARVYGSKFFEDSKGKINIISFKRREV